MNTDSVLHVDTKYSMAWIWSGIPCCSATKPDAFYPLSFPFVGTFFLNQWASPFCLLNKSYPSNKQLCIHFLFDCFPLTMPPQSVEIQKHGVKHPSQKSGRHTADFRPFKFTELKLMKEKGK